MEDLKRKLEGSKVLKYLLELPEFPIETEDIDFASCKNAFIGRMRHWVRAQRRPVLVATSAAPARHKKDSVFLKAQLRKKSNLLKPPEPTDKQLQFDDGKRFRASSDGGHKGKVKDKGRP